MRVLFVCMGNICRSPLAEGILRREVEQRGLSIEVDSAGVGSWHIGNRPDARAIVAGRAHGLDLTQQRARQLTRQDLMEFDWVLTMDEQNLSDIRALAAEDTTAQIRLLADFDSTDSQREIPDPYYTGRFEPAIAQITRGVTGFLDYLKEAQNRSASETKDL